MFLLRVKLVCCSSMLLLLLLVVTLTTKQGVDAFSSSRVAFGTRRHTAGGGGAVVLSMSSSSPELFFADRESAPTEEEEKKSSSSGTTTTSTSTTTTEEDADVSSLLPSMFTPPTPHERLGLSSPDQLALGVKPEEVLQYLGTRQDLMDRIRQDIPNFNKKITTNNNVVDLAEQQVDKLLMDAEILNVMIAHEKAKANNEIPEGAINKAAAGDDYDVSFRNPKVIATYAAWLAGGIGFSYIRRTYIQPKFDSGEWEEIHISLPNNWFGGGGGGGVTAAVEDGAAANAVASTLLMLPNHEVVLDAVNTVTTTTTTGAAATL